MESENERMISEVLEECQRLTKGGTEEWRDIRLGLYITKSYEDGYRFAFLGTVFEVWPKCHPQNARIAHKLLGLESHALLKALETAREALIAVKGQMPYHDGDFTDGEVQSMLKCDAAISLLKEWKEAHNGI